MSLAEFIRAGLAQVDDLAELKVTLAALALLEGKPATLATVSAAELAAHPAVRSLSFPDLTLRVSLQKAVARGSLIAVPGDAERFWANTPAAQHAAATWAAPAAFGSDAASGFHAEIYREIERLEVTQAYQPADADRGRIDEWASRGYTASEILAAVRSALSLPRPAGAPVRGPAAAEKKLFATAPAAPTQYYRTVIARTERPSEEVVLLRELIRRPPTGREFNTLHTAIGMFGSPAAREVLKRLAESGTFDIDTLIPLLAEQESAELALARFDAAPDVAFREIIQLYETIIGLPPTHAADMRQVFEQDQHEVSVWKAALEYAARTNKKDWRYIRALLLNPSSSVFEPLPANEAARLAFADYKKRVGKLDPSVAAEINQIAAQVTDPAVWTHAIDAAASANVLNWNYIKKVVTAPPDKPGKTGPQDKQDGRRKRTTAGPGSAKRTGTTYRLPQVEYDDERRAAARERARQRLAQRQGTAAAGTPGDGGKPEGS